MIDRHTLMSWRQEFLEELESILGPRDVSFSLGNVVPIYGDVPHTFLRPDGRTVDIRLTGDAWSGAHDGRAAKWQLAHECVHLIDPHFNGPTNVMEEGIATWFQNRKVEEQIATLFMHFGRGYYAEAEHLVAPLMNDGYLPEALRLLRTNDTPIGRVTCQQLVQVAEEIDLPTAEALTARFRG